MDDAGNCQECPGGYYCPGDDTRVDCPPVSGNIDDDFISSRLEYFFDSTFRDDKSYYLYTSGITKGKNIQSCRVIAYLENSRGSLFDRIGYNDDTKRYDRVIDRGWYQVSPGYYLASPGQCGSYAYYNDVGECPPGYYCPGKEKVSCNASNKATVHTETFGLNPCPARSTNEIAGAASVTQCVCTDASESMRPIGDDGACTKTCAAGVTEFHAGDLMFRLWGECASPALRVGIGGDVCCVNLESGTATGAVHVQYGGNTYHTVN